MKQLSRYVLVVDDVSSQTATRELDEEFSRMGRLRDVARSYKARCALIESADAKYAWQKMDGFRMDGRRWKVDFASRDDFDMFGWKWYEGRSPSPYRSRGRSRSRSPPNTPHDKDRKRGNNHSASPASRPSRSKSRSPSPAPRDDDY